MGTRRTSKAPDGRDGDRVEIRPAPPRAPGATATTDAAMPTAEPVAVPLGEQRRALQQQAAELEDQVRFMGAAHPQRQGLRDRLSQVRKLLQRIDDELSGERG